MNSYDSEGSSIRIHVHEPDTAGRHPALLLLHGSGGSVSYWVDRFAPTLGNFGVASYAPHYFDKTGTQRATVETILDGKHFAAWLTAIRDAISYIAARPSVDPQRIGLLGISLGAYLGLALATEDSRIRAVVELSGGIPVGWEDRVTSAMPPVLIIHGMQDSVVPVSEAYKLQSLLERNHVAHQVEILPNESHWFSAAAQPRLLMTCASFLGRYL
jgi:carboxymethylenebutenolidase